MYRSMTRTSACGLVYSSLNFTPVRMSSRLRDGRTGQPEPAISARTR
jgi:hypothetical protein